MCVCCQHFQTHDDQNDRVVKVKKGKNTFSSETIGPIKAKFHMEPPWDGEAKVCSNGPSRMTKIVAMPIYDKTFKIFFSRTKGLITLNWVCSIWCSSTTKVVQLMTSGGP